MTHESTVAALDTPDDLPGLYNKILRRGEGIVSALSSAGSAPRPFRASLKNSLLQLVSDIGELLGEAEALVPGLSTGDTACWIENIQSIRATLSKINEMVDHVAGLAIRGKLDKQFLLLSPLANSANLSAGLRLRRLEHRLAGSLFRKLAEDEMVADPDLLAISYISPPAEVAEPSPGRSASTRLDRLARREQEQYRACVEKISASDELERNEAVVGIIREYPHWLLSSMLRENATSDAKLSKVLETLSDHAELILLEDYFYSNRRMKLSHLLAAAEAYPVSSFFRRLLAVYHGRAESSAEQAVASVENPTQRATLTRVLLFHPMGKHRSYAASHLAPSQFWPVASYPHAPVLALDEILRRLRLADITDDFRKVFFDCTSRRIQNVEAEAEVRAAREILNRLFEFDFFMEDHYFKRLLQLNESVESQEKRLDIENSFFRKSLAAFLIEKDRVGSKKTQLPKSFADVPITVQRKLARDGHYLNLFIRHPHPKVALETLPYVSSSGRVEHVFEVRTANHRLIAELAKRDDLITTYKARYGLVSHPKTPLKLAMKHIPQLRREDLSRLAESRDINPEIRRHLRSRVRDAAR